MASDYAAMSHISIPPSLIRRATRYLAFLSVMLLAQGCSDPKIMGYTTTEPEGTYLTLKDTDERTFFFRRNGRDLNSISFERPSAKDISIAQSRAERTDTILISGIPHIAYRRMLRYGAGKRADACINVLSPHNDLMITYVGHMEDIAFFFEYVKGIDYEAAN